VQKLFDLSALDESVLLLPLPDSIFGFHGQQATEKLLKALLAAHQVNYPLSHSLKTLIKLAEGCGERFPMFPYDPLLLEPYAVQNRYDFGPIIDENERTDIRSTLALLRGFVASRSLDIEGRHGP